MAAAAAYAASAVLGGGARAAQLPSRSLFRPPLPLASPHPRLRPGARRFSPLQMRASTEETSSSLQTDELFADLKEKWDNLENKSTVFIYGGGAIVAIWLSSVVVGAINSVPVLPKIMELVGLGYSGWFVYRYLLFKSSRKELAEDIEALKKKIAGTSE